MAELQFELQGQVGLLITNLLLLRASCSRGWEILHSEQPSLVRLVIEFIIILWAGRVLSIICFQLAGEALGWYLRRRTALRTQMILVRIALDGHSSGNGSDSVATQGEEDRTTNSDEKGEKSRDHADWKGIVGFFHPFW